MRLKEPKRTNEKVYFFGQRTRRCGALLLRSTGAAPMARWNELRLLKGRETNV